MKYKIIMTYSNGEEEELEEEFDTYEKAEEYGAYTVYCWKEGGEYCI